MALTDTKIKNLKAEQRPYKKADFNGLYVLVNPSGSKLWRFKYRFNNIERLIAFGKYPDISLQQARQLRDEARSQLAQGIEPSEHRKQRVALLAERTANSFEKVASQYLDKIKAEGRAGVTMRKNSSFIAMANRDFGKMSITEISSRDILKTLKKIEAKGNYETAHRVRSTVGAVFRYAIANGFVENDPTIALRDALIRPRTKSHAAIIDKRRLGQLLRSIDEYSGQNTTKLCLKLQALLATRPSELRKAKWSEFNFDANIWIIPAERMKTRVPHTIPLSQSAINLLLELKQETGWSELLFPSASSPKKPISENTLNKALRRMGFTGEEMTAHGFRATFSSLANESGLWHPDAIERALAHVERNEVRRAYARSAFWDEHVKMADW